MAAKKEKKGGGYHDRCDAAHRPWNGRVDRHTLDWLIAGQFRRARGIHQTSTPEVVQKSALAGTEGHVPRQSDLSETGQASKICEKTKRAEHST